VYLRRLSQRIGLDGGSLDTDARPFCLQCVIGTLAAHEPFGGPMEFVVDQLEKIIGGLLVALAPIKQHLCYISQARNHETQPSFREVCSKNYLGIGPGFGLVSGRIMLEGELGAPRVPTVTRSKRCCYWRGSLRTGLRAGTLSSRFRRS
jgi:hypothetical protein